MRQRPYIIALGLISLTLLPVLIPPSFGLTDHLIFWFAAHQAVAGASPYDIAAWTDAQRAYDSGHLLRFLERGDPVWVYPAWSVLLFLPFGLLPYPAGPWALHLSYLVVGLAAAVLFVRSLPARWQLPAELAAVLVPLFQPLLIADRYGQFGSFLLLGTVLVYRGLRDQRAIPLVAGALVLFAKPQLFLVLASVVLVLLVRARAWRLIAITAGALAVVGIATTVRYPESLAFFGRGASDRADAFSIYATTWALAHALAPAAWIPLALILVGFAVVATVMAVRRLPTDLRLAGILAGAAVLSLAIAPVSFGYDQVPLLLSVILAIAVGRRGGQLATVWLCALLVPWLAFFAALGLADRDAQAGGGVVPLLMALAFWLSAAGRPRPSSPALVRAKVPRRDTG